MDNHSNTKIVKVERSSELELTSNFIVSFLKDYRDEVTISLLLLFALFLGKIAGSIVTLFILSYAIALICNPLLTYLERRKISRPIGFCIILLAFLGFLGLFFGFLIPVIVSEYSSLIGDVPELSSRSYGSFKKVVENSLRIRLSLSHERIKEIVTSLTPSLSAENIKIVLSKFVSTLFVGYSASVALLNLFLLPLIIFYICKDWKKVNSFFVTICPKSYQNSLKYNAKEIEKVITSFARGQVTVAIALSVMYSLALTIAGLPYAIPIGIVSGALCIIPYFGLAIGIVLSLLVQGTFDASTYGFSKVLIAFSVVQFLEGNLITPKIVGESMGLHPIVVIFALLIGGSSLGIVGLLLAIPIAALIKLFFLNLLRIS